MYGSCDLVNILRLATGRRDDTPNSVFASLFATGEYRGSNQETKSK
jgi:hypothetical protein